MKLIKTPQDLAINGAPPAFGEVFNVAAGGRYALNELYALIKKKLKKHIDDLQENDVIYRDFRAGDIRHSNANISKAQNLVGYEPSHDIYQGMEEAIEWYITDLKK